MLSKCISVMKKKIVVSFSSVDYVVSTQSFSKGLVWKKVYPLVILSLGAGSA